MNSVSYSSAAEAVHGRGEVVTKGGELLGARFDEVEVLAVPFLGLVAARRVVGPLGGFAVGDQLRVLDLEELELPPDDVLEGQTSSR